MVGPYASKLYRRLYGLPDPGQQAKEEEKHMADVVATAIQSQVVTVSHALSGVSKHRQVFLKSSIAGGRVKD